MEASMKIAGVLKKAISVGCAVTACCLSHDIQAMETLDMRSSDHHFSPKNFSTNPSYEIERPSSKIFTKLNQEEKSLLESMQASFSTIKFEDIERDIKPHMHDYMWTSVCSDIQEALRGDLSAQQYVGHTYRAIALSAPDKKEGLINKAIQWILFSLRDDGGDGDAEIELATIYDIEKNNSERANFWWQKAADKGSAQAREYLGIED